MDADFRSITLVVPHPDDEILGCGGFISQCAAAQKSVHILFLTKGEGSHRTCCRADENQAGLIRKSLAFEANSAIGLPQDCIHFLDGKDAHLPRTGENGFFELVEKIARQVEFLLPEAVLCPHPLDGWADHVAAEELTRAAFDHLSRKPRLFHYCIWFWHNMPWRDVRRVRWRNARLLNIAAQSAIKKRAMGIYLEPKAPCGRPWVGKLPPEFLSAFDWEKELFFEVDGLRRSVKE